MNVSIIPGQDGTQQNPGHKLKTKTPNEAFDIYFKTIDKTINSTALIISSSGLKKGRSEHPIPWYAREILQNIVDENPKGRNLDGVDIKTLALTSGKTRIVINQNWAFKKFAALTAIMTGKKDYD